MLESNLKMNKKFNWIIPKPHFLKLLKHEISSIGADTATVSESTVSELDKFLSTDPNLRMTPTKL
jgi:hypothetical protein